MKLTKKDRGYLKECGYLEEDMKQIERAITKTVYLLNDKEEISCMKTIELLGMKNFLSAIGRSAFHGSAEAKTDDGNNIVSFDSSRLFK